MVKFVTIQLISNGKNKKRRDFMKSTVAKIAKIFLFLVIFFSTCFVLFAKMDFANRNAYVSISDNTSGFRIVNKNAVSGYKKQAIIKKESANALFLQNNQTWQTTGDQLAPEETFEFIDNLKIPDGQLTQFSVNVVIDGKGHDLILGKYAQLLIDSGVTVTFKNMTIKNTLNTISCPPIRCIDWYSQACFDTEVLCKQRTQEFA